MNLTAAPPVADPVPCDVDDAVIKEAKRRARRRRWGYGGVVAVVLATAAAFVTWDATSSPAISPPAGFLGLPPERAVPSSPPTGELVVEIPTENVRIWVFADGRMISMRMNSAARGIPGLANSSTSGFLEQHLTPSGVEALRSYVIDHAGDLVEETLTVDQRVRDVRVRVGDQLYRSPTNDNPPFWWRCHWNGCSQYVANLDSVLPASAWVQKEYRPYVPSQLHVCFGGQTPDGQSVRTELVRDALPPEARELLSPLTPSGDWGCAVVGPNAARAINESLQAAGFGPAEQGVAVGYVFKLPPAASGSGAIEVRIGFITVLPNGEAEGDGG